MFGGGEYKMKCGLCGKEVDKQPMITAEGKCSVCGAKLKPA
jgi:DNA-directed RNA polymerase subunit RPC12/RpoP